LLATGGAGHVFSDTTNPPVATGDGVAMAYRAGATVADLEFVQFHPTALKVAGQPRFLLSEALRGEGARLLNAAGERFMERYDPAGELAPRDRVARSIELESRRTGAPIYLSLQTLDPDFVHERFPLISATCREAGLDLARDRIPVGPAAHYIMGGVQTDLDGRTTIGGLFAAGEVACTGVHGANRLASNSLLEGLVFGARAGRAMRTDVRDGVAVDAVPNPNPHSARGVPDGFEFVNDAARRLQAAMWRDVGLFRNRAGLEAVVSEFDQSWHSLDAWMANDRPLDAEGWRVASILTVGRLIARAALRREESRGAHYRDDFPVRDDIHWQRRVSETI
jgi:L-aspartate oxidase